MKKFCFIIPIFNRPEELDELLTSFAKQTFHDFEVMIIDDGSTIDCSNIIKKHHSLPNLHYQYRKNGGPGSARNLGVEKTNTEWVIFLDSDVILPQQYLQIVNDYLKDHQDCSVFGGPDTAAANFSPYQKAINYSMTSLLTTGGIRGRRHHLSRYEPRSFNMGIKRELFTKTGGFSNLHPGEDPELCHKIFQAGHKINLIEKAFVYHKRRATLRQFFHQTHKFGIVRTVLWNRYPSTRKPHFLLPALFTILTATLVLLSFLNPLFSLPLALFILLTFTESLVKTKSLSIAVLSIIASFLQLIGYGSGTIIGFIKINLLRQKPEQAFPRCFFLK